MNGTELFLLYVMGYALYGAINIWNMENFMVQNYTHLDEVERNFWLSVSVIVLFVFWLPFAIIDIVTWLRKPK